MHPRNILVDEETYQITAIVDWEWTYAAPRDFLITPPSWLVLVAPTSWIESSEIKFKKQFMLFLRALEDAESKRKHGPALEHPDERRISTAMRQNFENGTFWFVQLLLQSVAIFQFRRRCFMATPGAFSQREGIARSRNPRRNGG
jgi:hypothetical protein